MKTRRILAASTAALLAFGTTAIVAFAGDSTEYTVTLSVASSAASGVADADAAKNAVTVTVTASESGSDNENADLTASCTITKTATAGTDAGGNEGWTVGYTIAGAGVTGLTDTTASASKTVFVKKAAEEVVVAGNCDANVPNQIKLGGGSYTEVGPAGKTYTDTGSASQTTAGATADVTGTLDTGLTATIAEKDAKKLTGKWIVTGSINETPEDDDEKVDVAEDAIKDLGLSDENKKILAKTDASKVKLLSIKVGKGDRAAEKVQTSISKPLSITVASFKGAKVYHVNSDGSLTKLSATTTEAFAGGYETEFKTTNFSPFIVTTADLKASAASTDDTSSAATSNGSTSTNPNTGIALAIAPVVLAAGAVAVVALKKKH